VNPRLLARLLLLLSLGIAVKTLTLALATGWPRTTAPGSTSGSSELETMVSTLEGRYNHHDTAGVSLPADPLRLDRIVHSTQTAALRRAHQSQEKKSMRLSCTIVSSRRTSAIITYLKKSYIVGVGDELFGRRIEEIDKEKVVFSYQGTRRTLYTKPSLR